MAEPWRDVAPIGTGEVIFHIGPPKTGSSSMQVTMAARRAELVEAGVLYPGSEVRAKYSGWAVMGVQQRGMGKPRMAEWEALVAEVDDSGLRAVVSAEAFARADAAAIARMVASFGADRVHVVAVGRRLDKALPSLYQEKVKKFLPKTYEEWLAKVLAGPDLDAMLGSFFPGQQLGLIAEKWAAHIPLERFHLIVADESDRALMPRSFERLLALPEGFLEPVSTENESLDRDTIEMLRRLNVQKKVHGWPDDFYRALIFDGAVEHLRTRAWEPNDRKLPPPPAWALERIGLLTDHAIARLRDLAPHVIGDLDHLRPAPPATETAPPPSETLSMSAAVTALTGAVDAAWRRDQADRQV